MKYFVMSDIHGDYPAMMQGLKESGYNKKDPNHQIIVIGDYFGRATVGKGPYGIFKYLTSKTHVNKPICIKGNHEEWFVKPMLERGYVSELDCWNGEDKTIYSFFEHIPHINDKDFNMQPVYDYLTKHPVAVAFEDRFSVGIMDEEVAAINMFGQGKQLKKWLDEMPYYFETEHYVFTHGWLPYRITETKKISNRAEDYAQDPIEAQELYRKAYVENSKMTYKYHEMDLHSDKQWHYWIWVKTPEEYELHKRYYPNGWDKWIVVGHWHAFAFGPRAEFFQEQYWDKYDIHPEEFNYVVDEQHKVIFCDHCTVYGHKINVLVIEDNLEDKSIV